MDYSPWSERAIWPFLKVGKISKTGETTPTKLGFHAFYIDLYFHEFFRAIMWYKADIPFYQLTKSYFHVRYIAKFYYKISTYVVFPLDHCNYWYCTQNAKKNSQAKEVLTYETIFLLHTTTVEGYHRHLPGYQPTTYLQTTIMYYWTLNGHWSHPLSNIIVKSLRLTLAWWWVCIAVF